MLNIALYCFFSVLQKLLHTFLGCLKKTHFCLFPTELLHVSLELYCSFTVYLSLSLSLASYLSLSLSLGHLLAS